MIRYPIIQSVVRYMSGRSLTVIDVPPTLIKTTIHNKHPNDFMAKSMNELAHRALSLRPGKKNYMQ